MGGQAAWQSSDGTATTSAWHPSVESVKEHDMNNVRFFDGLVERLQRTGISADTLRPTGALMWRGVLLGTALYLVLGEDPEANLKLNGVSYIVALVWAYYDGLFARRLWSMAFVEAIFLHILGVQVGNLLAAIFGNPLLGT